jgi:hypothetical protein
MLPHGVVSTNPALAFIMVKHSIPGGNASALLGFGINHQKLKRQQ